VLKERRNFTQKILPAFLASEVPRGQDEGPRHNQSHRFCTHPAPRVPKNWLQKDLQDSSKCNAVQTQRMPSHAYHSSFPSRDGEGQEAEVVVEESDEEIVEVPRGLLDRVQT
jgi:hypothetical protein